MEDYIWAWASGDLAPTQNFPESEDYILVPYWYYYEHYRNPNPWPVCLFDDTWAKDAEAFITNQVRPVTRNVGSWSHFNQQLSNNTANRVQTSYAYLDYILPIQIATSVISGGDFAFPMKKVLDKMPLVMQTRTLKPVSGLSVFTLFVSFS
jgi:hypothetical protein